MEGIKHFRTGTQPILSFRGLQTDLEIAQEADIQPVRKKSQHLTQLFFELLEDCFSKHKVTLQSPINPEKRGSQVVLHFEGGFAVIQALIAKNIIADFKEPGSMRFGFAPLYLRYADVRDAAEALSDVFTTEEWQEGRFQHKDAVT